MRFKHAQQSPSIPVLDAVYKAVQQRREGNLHDLQRVTKEKLLFFFFLTFYFLPYQKKTVLVSEVGS